MKEYAKAAQLLGSVAPGHPKLRYAQCVALVGDKKYGQASNILKNLARGDADPRIHVPLGYARMGMRKKNDAVDHFLQALTNEEEEEDAP